MNPLHALRALENALDQVDAAERSILTAVEAVQSSIRSVHTNLERGLSLNELGELQARGPAVDVAIARHEQAVRSFSNLYRLTREVLTFESEDTPAEAQYKQAILDRITVHPRLSKDMI
jgi:hypothetical protein